MPELVSMPWERQPHDTPLSWAVFRAYLDQEPPRNLIAAYKTVKGLTGRVKGLPGALHKRLLGKQRDGVPIPGALSYIERERAWEDYLAALERQKWIERRIKIRESEWEVGAQLMERGKEMLMFPVFEQVATDQGMIIKPADWRLKDIPVILIHASKLLRLATGMSTDNLSINWREEAEKEGYNPEELFNQIVSRIKSELEQSALGRADDPGSLAGGETPGSGNE